MWKLALSQLRLQPRRYVAVMLAIVLGTMFLATSMLVTSSAKETSKQLLGATYANADLLIVSETQFEPVINERLAELAGSVETPGSLQHLDGVAEVYPVMSTPSTLVLPENSTHRGTFAADSDFLHATNRPADASLLASPFTAGGLPEHDTEIALDAETAQRHGIAVGDTVTLRTLAEENALSLTVSGLLDLSADALNLGAASGYVTTPTLGELAGDTPGYDMALVRVDGDLDQVMADIQRALDAAQIPATVNTADVQISEQLVDMMGFDAITVVLGGFALIALLVMMLVINNTFSVLVAQRTRQYALQRVLGATRGQIRNAVLAESVLLGFLSSVLGVLLAIGLMLGLMTLAQRWVAGAIFGMDLNILWVLAAGVIITVVASWAPAAKATRVSPLEAMRPIPEVTADSKSGIFRLVAGAIALLAGGTALIFCALQGLVLEAILAGAVSFIGVLALGTLGVPGAVYALGWLPRATGVPGKMAQLNTVRNRSRTAATATALIIGTTLVALILTGGRTVQQNTDDLLASNYPVDISATLSHIAPTDTAQIHDTVAALSATAGIANAAALTPVATFASDWASSDLLLAGDPLALADISAGITHDEARQLQAPGTVLVPKSHTSPTLTVTTGTGEQVMLETIRSELSSVNPVVSTQTGQQLGIFTDAPPIVWLSVAHPEASPTELQDIVTTMIANTELSGQDVESPLMLRGIYQQIIDVIMLTVIGLLGISVLIAFIGVANTLALSAMERTRENALLRALGLTKHGLRATLMWEAILISAVGAILGSVLGMLYGWAGSVAIFAGMSDDPVAMTWPWVELLAVVSVAVLAGLIASVAPSHRAAKRSPITGLAAE